MAVACTVLDDRGGRLLARLIGELDLASVSTVRVALLKCLAEQPTALLVDISGLVIEDSRAPAVFTAVIRQAATWPGTPVLICAPAPPTAALLATAPYRRLPVCATVATARDAARQGRVVMPSMSDDLLPAAGAARQGRNIATEACMRWGLPHLMAPSCLVAGELIANGVVHARTMMTLRLSLSRRYLHISVRDGSTVEPVWGRSSPLDAATGRGLRLVTAAARTWGSLPVEGGKVVWASLRIAND